MNLYWTSRETINGLKHFVIINQYELKKEVYLDLVSVLDETVSFSISKKAFEKSSQWIKGWINYEKENIDIKEYQKFKSTLKEIKPSKIILNDSSLFNIS
tara:strand:- start:460 stop:759 length:300 start_codon:yes stop_codon:yes gene_type:complete